VRHTLLAAAAAATAELIISSQVMNIIFHPTVNMANLQTPSLAYICEESVLA